MNKLAKSSKKDLFSFIAEPTNALEFLGFSIVNALIGLLSNANPVGFIAVPIIALSWAYTSWRKQTDQPRLRGISLTKEQPQPASGLVLLISAYSARDRSLSPDQISNGIHAILADTHLSQAEFEAINFFHSNLQPQLEAIAFHLQANTLQEIWLLPTHKSLEAADLLRVFVRWKYGDRLRIHCESPLPEYDYESLFRVIDRIFERAPYKADAIVADITGGTKMMSVALSMACTPPGRRMQYMDEEMQPVALDVDPILYGEG